jgi:large conductance mechanosensitive channel
MAFIMGAASTNLVNSLVRDIIMPVFSPLTSSGNWSEAILTLGPISIRYGSFLGELLNFVILGFVVYIIAKKLLKMDNPNKK